MKHNSGGASGVGSSPPAGIMGGTEAEESGSTSRQAVVRKIN